MLALSWQSFGAGGLTILLLVGAVLGALGQIGNAMRWARSFLRPGSSRVSLHGPGADKATKESIRAAALVLRTELRDIQRKCSNVQATVAGHVYAEGFAFPAYAWDRHHALLVQDPALYAAVERAYAKAHRANELINLRRTRAKGLIGRADEEDLPGVSRLAGDAIAALSTVIGESPQDAYRQRLIGDVERSRESLHRTFDNWQELFPLGQEELFSWLSEWGQTFQEAADEIGGETITIRVGRWIGGVDPNHIEANNAIVDRVDAAITQALAQLRGELVT